MPDVLYGLENFGYLSSDQSIELFEILMQLRREFPELARVLQYDAGDRPVCTGTFFIPIMMFAFFF